MIIRMYPTDGLKGQKLLALQADSALLLAPRALPWAMSFLAFQAVIAKLENNSIN